MDICDEQDDNESESSLSETSSIENEKDIATGIWSTDQIAEKLQPVMQKRKVSVEEWLEAQQKSENTTITYKKSVVKEGKSFLPPRVPFGLT